jgi:hypothetical protein
MGFGKLVAFALLGLQALSAVAQEEKVPRPPMLPHTPSGDVGYMASANLRVLL